MKDPLGTYLHDHLAGATFAMEMLEALKEAHPSATIGDVSRALLIEIGEDRAVLQGLVERVSGSSGSIKEAVTWIAEKAARLKLRRSSASTLGTFETLEALALGILGKEHLWRALAAAATEDLRLQGPDYPTLASRARSQHAVVDELRIGLAREALVSLGSEH